MIDYLLLYSHLTSERHGPNHTRRDYPRNWTLRFLLFPCRQRNGTFTGSLVFLSWQSRRSWRVPGSRDDLDVSSLTLWTPRGGATSWSCGQLVTERWTSRSFFWFRSSSLSDRSLSDKILTRRGDPRVGDTEGGTQWWKGRVLDFRERRERERRRISTRVIVFRTCWTRRHFRTSVSDRRSNLRCTITRNGWPRPGPCLFRWIMQLCWIIWTSYLLITDLLCGSVPSKL